VFARHVIVIGTLPNSFLAREVVGRIRANDLLALAELVVYGIAGT
jgi:hypothetical protein